MANRRMFSKKVIDTDYFLDLPATTQMLYFHLALRADDDGFISAPKRIMRMIGSSDDDYKLLIAKEFVIPFQTGVCVIKHWRIHNYIQKDRYAPTFHKYEKSLIEQDPDNDNAYILLDTECIHDVSKPEPQVRLELGKGSKEPMSSNKFSDDDEPLMLSNYLLERIRGNDPKIKKPNLQNWAEHVDKLIRIDGRSPQEIRQVIDYCQSDTFWKSNILSTKKLREKFSALWIKVNGIGGNLAEESQKKEILNKYLGR